MLSDNNNTENHFIWNRVNDFLKFNPLCQYRGHSMNVPLPFQINQKYAVYAIDNIYESDELITMTTEEQKIYALDWQHSAFLFYPRNSAEFPAFIPDGDYCFL